MKKLGLNTRDSVVMLVQGYVILVFLLGPWVVTRCEENVAQPVTCSRDAFEIVVRNTGLGEDELLRESQEIQRIISRVDMRDTSVTFARKFVNNRRVWHFAVSNIQLPDPERITTEYWAKHPRTMEFWVDSSNGSLLLVRSVRMDDDETATEPPWSEVFRPLPELKETYWGVPDSEPVVTLREALNKCHSAPWMAKSWSAAYVMYSQGDQTAVPVWVIYFSGMPDMKPNPIAPITHQRNAVDASTGEVLMYFRYAINMSASPDAQNGD